MKEIYTVLVLVIFVNVDQLAAGDQPLHFSHSKSAFTQKNQLAALSQADPLADAKVAFLKKDFRFIAVLGFALHCPGLKEVHHKAIQAHGQKTLTGGTDDIYSELTGELVVALNSYATRYNQTMFSLLPANERKQLLDFVPLPKDPFLKHGQ